ncbi:protein kinase, partial [Burkholderia sp. SIMBA_048]
RAALSFDRNTRMPSVVRFIAEFDNEARAEKSGKLAKVGLAGFAMVCAAAVGVFALRSAPDRQKGAQPVEGASQASADRAASSSSSEAAGGKVEPAPAATIGS